MVRRQPEAGIRQEKSFEVMRCRRARGEKIKWMVEEAGLCRGAAGRAGTAAGVSTLGDAGGQRLREERVKQLQCWARRAEGGKGRVSLGTGQVLLSLWV